MNWKNLWEGVWYCLVFVLAIYLIENEGNTWVVEIAGDFFGAMALMFLAITRAQDL